MHQACMRAPATPTTRGGARNLFFSLLWGANHTNLYKNLIKIQIFNVNLGFIGSKRPLNILAQNYIELEPGSFKVRPLDSLGQIARRFTTHNPAIQRPGVYFKAKVSPR